MRRVVSVVLTLTMLPLFFPTGAAAAATPLPPDATVYTRGHGWGHARGLGQWGARGMAQSGAVYTTILTHYYAGVTWANRSLTEDIRVLVEESSDVVVTSDAPFRASWSNGTAIASSDGTYRFLRARYDGSNYRLERATSHKGPWSLVKASSMFIVFTRGSALLDLVFNSGSVRTYRGSIIARYYQKMRAINQLQLREYLYAVVPREMPSSWPAEALKSQAVAARTYAAYKKDNARARGNMFDICATTTCQVYGGYGTKSSPSGSRTVLERASTNKAVQDTGGKVLLYGGKPILAEYSSSTGGYSAPGNVAYQKAVSDPGDAVSPHHDWRTEIAVREIEAKWPAIGRLVDIAITKRNGYGEWGGRVLEMRLVGTAGSVTMSGNAWRSAFAFPTRPGGVQSNWFTLWYWRGEPVGAPPSITISSGDTATIAVQVRNTGSIAWSKGGYVRLAAPSGSRFSGSDWISPTRPASVARNVSVPSASSVAPGQIAEFRVPIHTAGVPLGVYTETFTMIADGWSTMPAAIPVGIEVVPGWTEEAANLITNGSFESRSTGWTPKGLSSGDGASTAERREGTRSFRFTGGGAKSVSQSIAFAGEKPRRFVLGGWNKTIGSSAKGGAVSLWARAAYTDGTTMTTTIPFSRASHAWQYGEKSFTTSRSRTLATITVGASYAGQTGQGFFDAVRLLDSPVTNPSFEDGMDGWIPSGLVSGDGPTTAAARDGSSALALTGGGTKRVEQAIVLTARAYERVALSAWSRADAPKADGGAMDVRLTAFHADGTSTTGAIDIPKTAHGWTRHETIVSFPKGVTRAVLSVGSAGQTGTLFVDGIRVLRTLTTNASFETGLTGWGPGGFNADDGIVPSARDGLSGVRLFGSGRPRVRQAVATAGVAGTRFVVAAWNRSVGTSSRGGIVGLIVTLHNTDGSSTASVIRFSGSPHPWTYREAAIIAPKRFSSVDVYAVFYDQRGGTYFDSIRLVRV